ncbi:MAG TPA: hypothetical protein VM915_12030 [Verrucomicrobiae bacterium]|nr:hypothetical protein [Verrucomicrobiae bacterium]
MWRALALAALLGAAACAHTPARVLTPIDTSPTIHGDFDGDGRTDSASFFEDDEGHLIVAVERAAARRPDEVWGGDIASLPRFTLRAAPPGRYIKLCSIYGAGCVNESIDIELTREGLIVEGVEDLSVILYYWSSSAFRDVAILQLRAADQPPASPLP